MRITVTTIIDSDEAKNVAKIMTALLYLNYENILLRCIDYGEDLKTASKAVLEELRNDQMDSRSMEKLARK